LLDALIPAFESVHPEYSVRALAVGSGQALELGRRGDADVLITHSPDEELQLMADGHGADRRPLMSNEFVLLGPPEDPADIAGVQDIGEAFRRIAESESGFVSRGDQSGTHRRELTVWAAIGVTPAQPWYIEAGLGMADALRVASERRAYVLSDIATWLLTRAGLELDIMSRGDARLVNEYAVIVVARASNAEGAHALAGWLTGPDAQSLIRGFGRTESGESPFVPRAPAVSR
jgi:tungstate transport system substrate-binding protein